MSKRFIITTNGMPAKDRDELTSYFENEQKYGFWHWFDEMWLITTYDDSIGVGTIRDLIIQKFPDTNTMVFELTDKTLWSGFGDKKMFEWMDTTWLK